MTMHMPHPQRDMVRKGSALLALWLIAAIVSTLISIPTAPEAGAAVPGAAPSNPTTPCTWNWNRWVVPDNFAEPFTDGSHDPTQAVFSQTSTALGANGWYEASRAPQFSYSGLGESGGPAEETTGVTDSEWSYGVGYYVLAPGSNQTITFSDPGRGDSHAFAFYDSSGNQFDRFPRIGSVRAGTHYIASEQNEGTDPSRAGALSRNNSWSESVRIRVPADGVVYIHYLHFDENRRSEFASVSGACGPSSSSDQSTNNLPGATVTVNVAANDTRVSASTVEIVGADEDTGDLVVEGQGTWRALSNGSITFNPDSGFVGDPSPVRYTARDTRGNPTAPTTVTITYLRPAAEPDQSLANPTGSTVTIPVVDNDLHVDPRSVSIVGADPATGSLEELGRGTWTVDRSSGAIIFEPEEDVEADPTPIQYVVRDVGGNALSPVQVIVSFAPELVDDESLANTPGDDVVIDVLENDLTSDIDPDTVRLVLDAETANVIQVRGEGLWTIEEDTTLIRFEPEQGFAGDPRPVRYTLADFDGNFAPPAEIIIDYVPLVEDDESADNPAGWIISLDLVGNDPTDDIDPETLVIDHPNYNPSTRSLLVIGEGTWTHDATSGAITFTPQGGFRDEPTPIQYVVGDDDGNLSEPATVTIRHLPIPVAMPDQSAGNQLRQEVRVPVLANDPSLDILDPNTLAIVGANPETGELEVAGEGTWSTDLETGEVVFVPRLAFEGNPRSISYIATDARGVAIEPTLVTVTYDGAVIPETIAFADATPVDTNWLWASFLTLLIVGLAVGLWVLSRPGGSAEPELAPRVVRRG